MKNFIRTIWEYYKKNKRDFPWRSTRDPYKILVSEIMLQQTQAPRVVSKYELFIKTFPDFQSLAQAPLKKVLLLWQGLGYNRRAVALKRTAEIVVQEYVGKFPKDFEKMIALPGIGKATAGDILAFAWNIPVVLIETNIRTVFIHFFFKNKKDVHDNEILPLIEKTLDRENPREWYAALMDYGAMLKKTHKNAHAKQSKHYAKQTPFKGSNRELRSHILRIVVERKSTVNQISEEIKRQTKKQSVKTLRALIIKNLEALVKEGIIKKKDEVFFV